MNCGAYSLNQPLEFVKIDKHSGVLPKVYSIISCDSDTVIVGGIKKAKDNDDLIVRLYEAYNAHSRAPVTVRKEFSKAYVTDLMENPISELKIVDGTVTIPMTNFEIATLSFFR